MIINERIERYVDACPAAIAGQSGHTTTFKLAIALVQGFGLNEALALPFLRRYNVRCQPPWREHELSINSGARPIFNPGKAKH